MNTISITVEIDCLPDAVEAVVDEIYEVLWDFEANNIETVIDDLRVEHDISG